MKVIKKIKEMRHISQEVKSKGIAIGFVPTMGALHEGQLKLIDVAKKNADFIVVSIFVNPLQFGADEDFTAYPKTFSRDTKLLDSRGVDVLFTPSDKEMYLEGYETYVELPELSSVLCGASRPGHFRGVCTVVCSLFNIVAPSLAVFGEKDAQQLIIIKKMVRDLKLDIKILSVPTVREPNGLAMSSRNVYLTDEERKDSAVLYQSLILAKKLVARGERKAEKIKAKMRALISSKPSAKIDYIEIVRKNDLKQVETLEKMKIDVSQPFRVEIKDDFLIAVAVWFGKARLIDNITLQIPKLSVSKNSKNYH